MRVANCNDSGAGSLRDSVACADSGDVIDLTRLGCGRIVLTSGHVLIRQPDLTLVGPGRSRLTFDGNFASRALVSATAPPPATAGTLEVRSMTIAHGRAAPVPGEDSFRISGGCIDAGGNLRLSGVDVHHCRVDPSAGGYTSGGGVSASNTLLLVNSNLYANVARNGDGGGAAASSIRAQHSRINGNSARSGGGLSAADVSLTYSTVGGNQSQAEGGGVYVDGRASFNRSTVSNNRTAAEYAGRGGGVWGREVEVQDSTFSGNQAVSGSAILSRSYVRINNSTIAFNRQLQTDPGRGGAVEVSSFELATAPTPAATAPQAAYLINSSIIASNQTNRMPGNDVAPGSSYVAGSNNLIERTSIRVPPDTLSAYPRLAPLAYNGGPTRTHALLGDSPAIDRGRNVRNRQYDQRGPGFARVNGRVADIGAFECGY